MAIIRQNLELLSPNEGDTDGARQNKITFFGFKDGENDFNDVTNGVGPTSKVTGSIGLNDATFGGVYTGSSTKTYRVKVTSVGTPDTFRYSDDNGSTYYKIASTISVPADSTLDLNSRPIYLDETDLIAVTAGAANDLAYHVSYVEMLD